MMFAMLTPALLNAQKNINPPQAQQTLNKADKSRFFIENKGQWPKQVKFLAKLGGMNAWITDSGVVYDYYRIDRNYSPDSVRMMLPHEKDEFERIHTSCKGHVVRMDYAGINWNAEKQGFDKRKAYYNYFIGNDSTKWASFVGLYGEVLVKDAYKGIDIRYYFDSGQIRYDYLVNPGADISHINFMLTGANEVAVNESGELIIQTSLGEVKHGKLYAYQQTGNEKREVSCRFVRKKYGNFRVIASDYEKGLVLVIDPLIYSTFIGGTSDDNGVSIKVNGSGEANICGTTGSANYPVTTGVYITTYAGGVSDAYITKLNASGSAAIFSTFIGGKDEDKGLSLDIDSINNIYLTGYTLSATFPVTSGAFQTNQSGGYDIFALKMNSTGSSLFFSTFLAGSIQDYSEEIVVDRNGNSYIVGYTNSVNFPITTGVVQPYKNFSIDCFVSKLNTSGTALLYSTFVGGSGDDYCNSIAIDKTGNAFITGSTNSINYPVTSGSFKTYNNGEYDGFITKLNATAKSIIYSTYIGGSNRDISRAISIDLSDNAYITGYTLSSDFPTTSGCFQSVFNISGVWDAFVLKLNSNGSSTVYSTYIGGDNNDFGYGIIIQDSNLAIITGSTWSANFPITPNYVQAKLNGTLNSVIITKLNSKGSSLLFSTFFGGVKDAVAWNVTTDKIGDYYFTGITNSSDYPVTSGALQTTFGGGTNDAFITKIREAVIINTSKIRTPLCAGDTLTVPYLCYSKADSGNKFTAQLSDSIGNFTNLVNIGTISSKFSGSIKCIIPKNINLASNYRIRVISSNPSVIGTDNNSNITIYPLPKVGFFVNDSMQCLKGNSFNFTNTSIISSGSITNYWNFGDTTTSKLTNPNHSFLTTDIFKTRLIVTSDHSCTDTAIHTMITIPLPIPGFSVNYIKQCQKGNAFLFTNKSTASSGTISNLWNFGDGDTSTQQNPQHSYSSSKSFNVKLVVTTGVNCSDSVTKTVVVLPSPTASFSINDSTQCLAGNNFIFTNNSTNSSGNITSSWQFGDGNNSLIPGPSHSYAYAGTFPVKLVVVSDTGCKDSIIVDAIVGAEPIASFIAYDSSQCLERNNFLFSNKSASTNGSFNCNWNFGDTNTSTLLNPMHKYSYADTFTVVLIITDAMGCSDTFSKHTWVHVHPEPLANFSINDSSQCLNGNVFALLNNSTIKSGTFYQTWDFADGYNTVSYNANHSYSLADSYMIKLLIISDWACKDSTLKKIYVRPDPKASFTINLNPQYKSGNKFIFTSNSVISSGNLHYFWDFGDGNSDISVNPIHSYSNSGTYYVKLIVTSDYGCADTFYDSAIVLKYTKINLSFSSLNGCVGIPVNFKNASTVAPPDSFINFLWDFGDGNQTIILDDPQHIYTSPGSYIITFIGLTAFGNKDTLTDTIEIFPAPTVDITAVPDTILIPGSAITLNANGTYDQLLWWDNSITQSMIVQNAGKYWVTASFVNGCKSSDTIWLIEGKKMEIDIVNVITPNADGYNDYFVIKNIQYFQPVKLSIFNRWGGELFSSSNYKNDWDGKYKGKDLPEGSYYYYIETRDKLLIKGAINIIR